LNSMGGAVSRLFVVAVAGMLVAGCGSSGATSEPTTFEEVLALQEQLDSTEEALPAFCDPLATYAAARPELPPVTQCETEDGTTGGRVLIVQFDDQIQNMVDENLDASEDMAINFPIDAVAQHLKYVRDELDGISTVFIAFRDRCQTVFEIPAAVMSQYVDGRMTRDQLVDQSEFSTLTYC
jgi:hypothetical protein